MAIELSRNWNAVAFRMENKAERSTSYARQAMREAAHGAVKLARAYAPVDEGNLEDGIEIEESRSGINGRYVFDIRVNDDHVGTRTKKGLGEYSYRMHEGFYDLGEASQLKDLSIGGNGQGFGQGGKVGRKFLQRAANEKFKQAQSDVRAAVKRGLK